MATNLTKPMVIWLKSRIREFAIDPHDANLIALEAPEGVTWEDLADYLDGQGYPNLAHDIQDDLIYVVWNTETGYSDESMRFANRDEALSYLNAHDDTHAIREELA